MKVLASLTTRRAHNRAYGESSKIKSQCGSRFLSSNLEVEKFNGTNNFGVWQGEVSDLLVMQDLDASLQEVMPQDMTEMDEIKSAILRNYLILSWQGSEISIYEDDHGEKTMRQA